MTSILLLNPQYRPNLSSMIRSAEFYGLKKIYISDNFQLMKEPENKKQRADMKHMAKVWTAGALEHIEIITIKNVAEFLEQQRAEGKRIVGTVVNKEAQHLKDFKHQENDLIILGNERDGLDNETISLLDNSIYIPQRGKTNCLNVAVTFGIVLHQAITSTT